MPAKTKACVSCRWAQKRDLAHVAAIEAASVTPPCWDESDFEQFVSTQQHVIVIAEAGKLIVGYMAYEITPQAVQIIKLVVSPSWRRAGVGRSLLYRVLHPAVKPSSGFIKPVTATVDDRNLDAHLFLKACGMKAIGVRGSFYVFKAGRQ